jgi:hypothetical protein
LAKSQPVQHDTRLEQETKNSRELRTGPTGECGKGAAKTSKKYQKKMTILVMPFFAYCRYSNK